MKKALVLATAALLGMSSGSYALDDVNGMYQEKADHTKYDPKTNPMPMVRPLDMPMFHLGFPRATFIPMILPSDTGGLFSGGIEHIEHDYYGPPHIHYHRTETVIVTEGTIQMRVGDKDMVVTEGQWVHVPAGQVHGYKSTGSPAKWVILWNYIDKPTHKPLPKECDRSDWTAEMNADPLKMTDWYNNCVEDFQMLDGPEPFETKPWKETLPR
ncbi:cupin domain-containing protein [Amphritea sp.]|uniref:cupin domain-containing protein n=1 Tax=Amphritea sp. TaxID=1872502 RepID=UPI003A8E61F8